MDVLIVLTGRRQHGKDTVADIGVNKFKCAGKLALADWFKEVLSEEFKIPLANFYDADEKDRPFEKTIEITKKNTRNLIMKLGDLGYWNTNGISTMRWWGRQLNSLRDMMLWFGNEVVTKNCGDTFHCTVTETRLSTLPRTAEVNAVFITDARKFAQSEYFTKKFPHVYPVRVVRPGGTEDDHEVEKANDAFPEDYFFETIVNDGGIEKLEGKVKALLTKVKSDLGKRLGKTKPKSSRKASTKGE